MIGREAERAALSQMIDDAAVGDGQARVLRGEPGVGKTVLLEHTVEEARTRGFRVLRCSGVETEVEQVFSGLHQLLRPVLAHLAALPETQAQALSGALGRTDSTATDLLVSAGTLSLLAEVAQECPLLIAVDDLPWLDRATAAALVFAARRLSAEPIAILLTARDAEHAIVDTGDLPELSLRGLPSAQAALLLAERGWELPRHVHDTVLAVTGGNPLALTELAAFDDRERLLADITLTGSAPVGERLRAAFLRRINTLPEDGRDLLLVAAAEDTGNTDTVLGAGARLGLPAEALAPAERAGLIRVTGARLRFHHPLVRSVTYADAAFDRRRAAHHAIAAHLSAESESDRAAWHHAVVATAPDEELAAALERGADAARRRGGEAAVASVLQRSAQLSGTPERRRDRMVSAAEVALDSGQPDLARTLAEEALAEPVPEASMLHLLGNIELYSGAPHVAFSQLLRCAQLLGATNPEEAAWVLMKAASAAFHAGDFEATWKAVRQIADLDCSVATRSLGHSMGPGGPLSASRLWELGGELANTHPRAGGRTWLWVMVIAWMGPEQHQARRLAQEAGRRLHAHGTAAHLAELNYYQGFIEYRLGQWDDGAAHAREGLRFSREMGQRTWLADNSALLALFAAGRGASEDCHEFAERALEIALPLREQLAAGVATAALGLLALGQGDTDRAWSHLSQLLDRGSPYAHAHTVLEMITEIVEAAVRAGQSDRVLDLLNELAPQAEGESASAGRAWVHHCRALLAGDAEEAAEQHFQWAISAQSPTGRPFQQARTKLHYGEWLRRNRRRAEARDPLRTAAEAFEILGAVPWARRAHAELRAAGGGTLRVGASATGRLSAQEREVARLAARGLNNREIGERLVLSPRTVGSHLYRLFPKLSISSRAQLRDLELD